MILDATHNRVRAGRVKRALKAGEVAVEPDKPETTFYVLTLDRKTPVKYMALMGPAGAFSSYGSEARTEVMRRSYTDGMARLRDEAKYKETKVGDLLEGKEEGESE